MGTLGTTSEELIPDALFHFFTKEVLDIWGDWLSSDYRAIEQDFFRYALLF